MVNICGASDEIAAKGTAAAMNRELRSSKPF
jgi:hypothetical protein